MKISKKTIKLGHEVANELITANICKNMNGLGGGPTWETFKKSVKHKKLCQLYLENKIDSITAIFMAMNKQHTKEINESLATIRL